jgi:hypothetical protein
MAIARELSINGNIVKVFFCNSCDATAGLLAEAFYSRVMQSITTSRTVGCWSESVSEE